MWVVPTIREVLVTQEPDVMSPVGPSPSDGLRAWQVAIATLTSLLQQSLTRPSSCSQGPATVEVCSLQGFMLVGPTPILSELTLLSHLQAWTFASGPTRLFQLPPVKATAANPLEHVSPSIPLLPADPLSRERFCLVQTPTFGWLAVLAPNEQGTAEFQFSFVPTTIAACLDALKSRIQLTHPERLPALEALMAQFPPCQPDYRVPMAFGRQLLATLSQPSPARPDIMPPPRSSLPVQWPSRQPTTAASVSLPPKFSPLQSPHLDLERDPPVAKTNANGRFEHLGADVELLQAIAHEVRTPLTTIQTFTRLLLKRSDLPTDVLKRLEAIQRECRQQIDRFGLIFRAMELTHPDAQHVAASMTSVCLRQILDDNVASWQHQAQRRGVTLTIQVPPTLPAIVISDPNMLHQMLTGLIERLSLCLPSGSEVALDVALAGEQLKLELRSHPKPDGHTLQSPPPTPILKAIGQLLMLQPETGGLSLNLAVTKHLFAVLGGKLTVRQHQHQGEILTIFLPLGTG